MPRWNTIPNIAREIRGECDGMLELMAMGRNPSVLIDGYLDLLLRQMVGFMLSLSPNRKRTARLQLGRELLRLRGYTEPPQQAKIDRLLEIMNHD